MSCDPEGSALPAVFEVVKLACTIQRESPSASRAATGASRPPASRSRSPARSIKRNAGSRLTTTIEPWRPGIATGDKRLINPPARQRQPVGKAPMTSLSERSLDVDMLSRFKDHVTNLGRIAGANQAYRLGDSVF